MLKRLLAKASPILGTRADWLGLCLLCRQPCDEAPLLCSWCRQALHQDGWQCRLCAAPLPEQYAESDLVCGRCQRRPPPWQRLQVIGDYRAPYSLLVPRLKYSGQILLAPLLARVLADHLNLDDPPQAIIPVPLHWWRQWWRGFNQAEEIALALGELTGIPCDTRVLRRAGSNRLPPWARAWLIAQALALAFAFAALFLWLQAAMEAAMQRVLGF